MKKAFAAAAIVFSCAALAQEPTLIRFGRGFAAEEQVWLMSARPDLTPNQGRKYALKQILFQANPERFQAFLAGELDAAGLWDSRGELPDSVARAFGERVAAASAPIDDVRGSAAYRRHALSVMCRRAATWAWDEYRRAA